MKQKTDLTSSALTFSDYLNVMLYSNNEGFYSSGKVNIGLTKQADFSTASTNSCIQGFILAQYAYRLCLYRSLIGGQPAKESPFTIVELGGGTGELAFNMLTIMEGQAGLNEHSKALFRQVRYVIYEISPALAARSREKNKRFIETGKLVVHHKSAEDITEKEIDFCISNEFWDQLPWDIFTLTESKECKVRVSIPWLSAKNFKLFDLQQDEAVASELKLLSTQQKNTHVILTKKNLKILVDKPKFNLDMLSWEHVDVPVECFPSIQTITQKYLDYFESLIPAHSHNISMSMIRIAEKLKTINTKLAMHFDYGCVFVGGKDNEIRTYSAKNRENKLKEMKAGCDITADIDFRLLHLIFAKEAAQVLPNNMIMQNHTQLRDLVPMYPGLDKKLPAGAITREYLSENIAKFCDQESHILYFVYSDTINLREHFNYLSPGLSLEIPVPISLSSADIVRSHGLMIYLYYSKHSEIFREEYLKMLKFYPYKGDEKSFTNMLIRSAPDNKLQNALLAVKRDNEDKPPTPEIALRRAADANRIDVVTILLDNVPNLNINSLSQTKSSAMYFAYKNGHEEMVALLASKGGKMIQDGKLVEASEDNAPNLTVPH